MTTLTRNEVGGGVSPHTLTWTLAVVMGLCVAGQNLQGQTPAARPAAAADIQVWTCDMVSEAWNEGEAERWTIKKEFNPITLVGARNGSFSGRVIIDSRSTLKGLQVSASALTGQGATIPASSMQLRYGVGWKNWDFKCNGENNRGSPRSLDILLESPPEPVDIRGHSIVAVWATVNVPKNAKAGTYTGTLTVKADGLAAVNVPVNLDVEDWTLPESQDFRTWMDFMQSPDTLALEYNVPLWSEQHWKLIARSFQLLSSTGARVVYIPLLAHSNFGNEQSMVRWIKKGENQYEYDYTILDRYLDTAEKNLGTPKIVVFSVWDICLSPQAVNRGNVRNTATVKLEREKLQGRGPRVTALDPATKVTTNLFLPRYDDPASKALWQPMFTEIRKRMEKRGLEKTMMLGMTSDVMPDKADVTFWKDASGDLPWVHQSHCAIPDSALIPGSKGMLQIAEVGYAGFGRRETYNLNLDNGRMYGWKLPTLLTSFMRMGVMLDFSPMEMREVLAFDITGGERGQARMGGDYWWAVRKSDGVHAGAVPSLYPENTWHDMDIDDYFLAPGPDGAVATARLEYLKEGLQVCEARIFLEDALLDDSKKAKVGADLAKRCQDALAEHHRAMWKTVWNNEDDLKCIKALSTSGMTPQGILLDALEKVGKLPADRKERWALIQSEMEKGQASYVIGWQDREKKLFALAGEVAAKLKGK